MINFKPTIGIEVHVVVKSKTKMFSNSKSSHNEEPNILVNEIDLGLPGILPSVNEEVVKKSIVLAKCLNMEIDKNIRFDRKNYFYQDLPKGYQITQQFFPIGKNGYIEIDLEDGTKKKININRIHMEEDTAKQTKQNNEIFLDYNRAGMPLVEIVTEPCINSSYEAEQFLKKLKKILQFNNVSDGKMEDGSMRADINISVAPIDSNELGIRSEIKNINSISNVGKAIEYEIGRKISLSLLNEPSEIDTRYYDDKNNKTIFMRNKTTNIDYRYMAEPNIVSINIDDKFINESINRYYLNFEDLENKLLEKLDNNQTIVNHILSDYDSFAIYKRIVNLTNNYSESYKFLFIEYNGLISKNNIGIWDIYENEIIQLSEIIKQYISENINIKQAKTLCKELSLDINLNVLETIEKLGLKQINDPTIIFDMIKNNYDQSIMNDLESRPEKVEKFYVGKVMKDSNGQANPNIIKQQYDLFVEMYKKGEI